MSRGAEGRGPAGHQHGASVESTTGCRRCWARKGSRSISGRSPLRPGTTASAAWGSTPSSACRAQLGLGHGLLGCLSGRPFAAFAEKKRPAMTVSLRRAAAGEHRRASSVRPSNTTSTASSLARPAAPGACRARRIRGSHGGSPDARRSPAAAPRGSPSSRGASSPRRRACGEWPARDKAPSRPWPRPDCPAGRAPGVDPMAAEHQRLARAHGDLPEIELEPCACRAPPAPGRARRPRRRRW